jgi:hypothetical protein
MRVELFWIEGVREGLLAVLPRPRGGDWLEDEVLSLRASGVDVLTSLLTREEEAELDLAAEAVCCAACGIEFVSFPFADRGVPSSDPEALALVRRLAALVAGGKAVVVHCRQGIGRSAVITACILASLGERPEAAIDRVARARSRPVPDTPEQREWVQRFADRHLKGAGGTVLLLSTRTMPGTPALADAARSAGWSVHVWDESPPNLALNRVVYYGRTDMVRQAAARYRLALPEPPLDLLARLPASLLLRDVEFARFRDLYRLKGPTFIKPADPLDRCFDAGVYSDSRDIRASRGIDPDRPVLVAEPVDFLAEFRSFVREDSVVATSPCLSFGRPVWRAWGQGGEKATPSRGAIVVCRRLLKARSPALPPAFAVDVGLVDGRGWAVVEFNPAWCSGLLGADPGVVLGVLERASRDADDLDTADAPGSYRGDRSMGVKLERTSGSSPTNACALGPADPRRRGQSLLLGPQPGAIGACGPGHPDVARRFRATGGSPKLPGLARRVRGRPGSWGVSLLRALPWARSAGGSLCHKSENPAITVDGVAVRISSSGSDVERDLAWGRLGGNLPRLDGVFSWSASA